jgi:hypothetical protein
MGRPAGGFALWLQKPGVPAVCFEIPITAEEDGGHYGVRGLDLLDGACG